MTDRELMQMALDGLNDSEASDARYEAIQALRDRLAQPEPEPVAIGEEWKPCVKLPIVVHVREQRKGETHVSTREGITPVREDDLIMRGVAGEEYPIGRELFNRTYTFDTSPPKREWVGDVTDQALIEEVRRRGFTIRDAQVSPKREWVGLTDEDVREAFNAAYDGEDYGLIGDFSWFAELIEAKLKEKNVG